MHLVVRESRSLELAAEPQDLGLRPADIVFLSFSDSDLALVAAAWQAWPDAERPSLRAVNLNRLLHPMTVDLFTDRTLPGTRVVLVRLLGGLDYWRYGGEELARACRALGILLAIVPGDFRPDPRLPSLSTVDADDLAAIEALLDAGGARNAGVAMAGLLARARGLRDQISAPERIADCGVYCSVPSRTDATQRAAVVFYRSHLMAGDVAPIDGLCDALALRGLTAIALFVPSLKAPEAARWLRAELLRLAPNVILNATAFCAREDAEHGSPLDVADCPVLQVALAASSQDAWINAPGGLNAADLAMHVVLPEADGRIFAAAISFKEPVDGLDGSGIELVRHVPHGDGIAHAADLAARWAGLRSKAREARRLALVLSTYPGRPDQIAHAVGLDGPASVLALARRLEAEGYGVSGCPVDGAALVARLRTGGDVEWPLADYEAAFARLPASFKDDVTVAWGEPACDPTVRNGVIILPVIAFGQLLIGLQPERGAVADRKAMYHDPSSPPRHGYVAFYLWLAQVAAIDALVHLGAHGTLEWLPGKAVALSRSCAPRAVLGAMPLVYPFIVNDPGEAAQAKRRVAAVTLGHKPPPQLTAGLADDLLDLERLLDEFASAEGLDPRRRKALAPAIVDAARRAGIEHACAIEPGMDQADMLARIDAFLCDVKELSVRDGLHVLDDEELDAMVRGLDGRFIQPGPAGAPSRGRSDVLPTGRNMCCADPRAIPTPTAWSNGQRAAAAILDRYLSDHGDWPKAIVLDLWGSATLRTGGEELATALALLGVRPQWDRNSFRVIGVETDPPAVLGRPRVDVTLRISGLFRDMFPTQIALFDGAVQLVAALDEDPAENPLVGRGTSDHHADRIFGPPSGAFGAGVMEPIDSGRWVSAADLGDSYLRASGTAFRASGPGVEGAVRFAERVRAADAFVHIQDHHETDVLTGGDYAAHEGGFAAAAQALGNSRVVAYHGDTGIADRPRVRTLAEECARVVHGRAANPRWIAGMMRHGYRGAAEMAQTVDAAFAFAATARAVDSGGFERLYDAYLGDPVVAAFIARDNPAAAAAMRQRFEEAIARGLWQPRRNDVFAAASNPVARPNQPVVPSEAAE